MRSGPIVSVYGHQAETRVGIGVCRIDIYSAPEVAFGCNEITQR